jgi:hypothetical protein
MKLRNTSFLQISLSNHDHFDGLAHMIEQPNVGNSLLCLEGTFMFVIISVLCAEGQIT